MKNSRVILSLVLLFIKSVAFAGEIDMCLTDGWRMRSSKNPNESWVQVSIPSTVRGALGNNADFSVPWIYEKEFSLPLGDDSQHVFLEFDGISYRAKIWFMAHFGNFVLKLQICFEKIMFCELKCLRPGMEILI